MPLVRFQVVPFDDSIWLGKIRGFRHYLSACRLRQRQYMSQFTDVPNTPHVPRKRYERHVYVLPKPLPPKVQPAAIIMTFEQEPRPRRDTLSDDSRWNNILRYLPYDDLFSFSGKLRKRDEIMRRAAGIFRSPWNSQCIATDLLAIDVSLSPSYGRDVERDAFLTMLENALRNEQVNRLTISQQETAVLDRVAKQANVAATTLISNVLSITVKSAERRLASTRAKIGGLGEEFDIIEIKQALETTPRYCPFCAELGHKTPIPVTTNSMCWAHHERFNLRRDFGRYPQKEYERVVMDANRYYWQSVRDTLDVMRGKVVQLPTGSEDKRVEYAAVGVGH